jgi:hypothetical protein
MEIWVEFENGKWRISPDPAVVVPGTLVSWRFRSDSIHSPRAFWTVHFEQRSPFRNRAHSIIVRTEEKDGQHAGATEPVPVDDEGDYKYAVRAADQFEKTIGDEDPRLIVRHRVRF